MRPLPRPQPHNPPRADAGEAGQMDTPSRVHAHEAGPHPRDHNLLTTDQADILRSSVRRIRGIQRQVDGLNKEKSAVYDAIRTAGIDPALVRRVVYRLTLSAEEIAAQDDRQVMLTALWSAVADLRDEEQPAAEPATTDA